MTSTNKKSFWLQVGHLDFCGILQDKNIDLHRLSCMLEKTFKTTSFSWAQVQTTAHKTSTATK